MSSSIVLLLLFLLCIPTLRDPSKSTTQRCTNPATPAFAHAQNIEIDSDDDDEDDDDDDRSAYDATSVQVSTPKPTRYNTQFSPRWALGTSFELRTYVSGSALFSFRNASRLGREGSVWTLDGMRYSLKAASFAQENVTFEVPADAMMGHDKGHDGREDGGIVYAHVFVVREGLWDVVEASVSDDDIHAHVLQARYALTEWIEVDEPGADNDDADDNGETGGAKADNDGDDGGDSATCGAGEVCSDSRSENREWKQQGKDKKKKRQEGASRFYRQVWKGAMPVVLVVTASPISNEKWGRKLLDAVSISMEDETFAPPMHVDQFWVLRRSAVPVATASEGHVTVEMSFSPMRLWKWYGYRYVEHALSIATEFGVDARVVDLAKQQYLDLVLPKLRKAVRGAGVLAAKTAVSACVLPVFGVLTYRSDNYHWQTMESAEGVSIYSLVGRVGMRAVALAHFADVYMRQQRNATETAGAKGVDDEDDDGEDADGKAEDDDAKARGPSIWLMYTLWSQMYWLYIAVTRLRRLVRVEVKRRTVLGVAVPWVVVQAVEGYCERTREHDAAGARLVGSVAAPLAVAYAAYAVKAGGELESESEGLGWVSRGLVVAFAATQRLGFVAMAPQMYVNWRMRTVANMARRTGLFAGVAVAGYLGLWGRVAMPWGAGMESFRDDVSLAVFLAQMAVYRGSVSDGSGETKKDKEE